MITATQIEELFGKLLSQVKDAELRRKTVEVWVEGCKTGGWQTVEELRAMPFTLLTDARGIDLVEHTIAVTEGALGLARAQQGAYAKMPIQADWDRLVCGGLLHDVGKLVEIERNPAGGYRKSRSGKCARHPISGTVMAGRAGLPDEILNCIACHAKEGEGRPQTFETVLIHQADYATFDPLVMLEKGSLIL